MKRLRFHLGTLVILVLILGFGFAALRGGAETATRVVSGQSTYQAPGHAGRVLVSVAH